MNAVSSFIKLVVLAGVCTATSALAQDNIILKNGSEIQAKVLEVSPGQIKYRRQDNPDGPIYTTGTTDVLLIRYANGTKDILGQSAGSATQPVMPAASTPISGGSALGSAALTRLGYHSGLFSHYFTDGMGARIDRSTVRSLVVTQPDAMQAFERGQSLRRWSYVTAGAAVALIGTGASLALLDEGGGGRGRRQGNNTSANESDGDRRGNHHSAVVGLSLAGGGVVLGVASLYLSHRATVQFRRAADRYNQRQPATSLRISPSQRGLGAGLTYTF